MFRFNKGRILQKVWRKRSKKRKKDIFIWSNKNTSKITNKEREENKEIKNVIINSKFMKEIMKLKEFSEMRCSF